VLIYGFLASMANDSLFVVYGAWLEDQFNLGLVALGTATTVIGLAELSGETLTATVADRLGLKRAITIGVVMAIISYALLPIIGQTLPLALLGLFLTFISFEFTIVTSFPLITEILPEARATMTASFLAAGSVGRMVGALMGGSLWLAGGLPLTGAVASLLTLASLGFFLWGLRHWQN
jgi:predicted MFS family arabinose efflux permease